MVSTGDSPGCPVSQVRKYRLRGVERRLSAPCTPSPGWSYFSASDPRELRPDVFYAKVDLCLNLPCAGGEG